MERRSEEGGKREERKERKERKEEEESRGRMEVEEGRT